MSSVIRLCDQVYLAGGAIVSLEDPGMFDDGRDTDAILKFGRGLAQSRFVPKPYGPLTVFGAMFNCDPTGKPAKYTMAAVKHASELPEAAKEIIRKEMPEHVGEI